MRQFFWLSADEIPHRHDLRRCGWQFGEVTGYAAASAGQPVLAPVSAVPPAQWIKLLADGEQALRRQVLLIGVNDPIERARLLRLGFGDAVHGETNLAEVEARAWRITRQAACLPRTREVGPLRLDLLARDGFVGDSRLGLHPREFALLWRLADVPGVPLRKKELVTDVWYSSHVPETNSLAVHISRLRTRLAHLGLRGLVQTAPSGGYFLAPQQQGAGQGNRDEQLACSLPATVRDSIQ